MIEHVYKRAQKSKLASKVIVATDDERIARAVEAFDGEYLMTRSDHATGTDRLAEVAKKMPEIEVIVNVQGDEPLIDAELISLVAEKLSSTDVDIVTVAHPIADAADFFNPNIVKVVCKANGDAMYFSRAPIPYARDHFAQDPARTPLPAGMAAFRHIGLYAYRARFLRVYSQLPPSPLESIEALEQLRAMWNGFRIGVVSSDHLPVPGVDTPEDAKRMQDVFARTQ